MKAQQFRFSGAILERGFWLYVWRVRSGEKEVLYVGRTGDSSSRYAASPFSRLGQHLDVRRSAQANMLLRHLRAEGLDPLACEFELTAIGPLFPEQTDLEEHRRLRDIVAPLETELAKRLREAGHIVIGSHHSRHALDDTLFAQVLEKMPAALLRKVAMEL